MLKTQINLYISILLGMLLFTNCSKDDSTNPDSDPNTDPNSEETSTLTANAGTDQSAIENVVVTLDGSDSADSQGETFTYLWEITSQPESSSIELSDNTIVNPTFTPTVAGEYTIELTIANDIYEDSDSVTITVTGASSEETVEIGGNIREDIVLTNIVDTPGVADYCITSSIDLDAVMTIEPGVELHFEADLSFEVGSNGVLIAKGTENDHIVFTAKDSTAPWRGIGFVLSDDFRNAMDYVDISYAGADIVSIVDRKAALGISSFSTLSFTNSSITNSSEYGMFVDSSVDLTGFANNSFENNAKAPLVLPAEHIGQLDTASQFGLTNGEDMIEIIFGNVNLAEPAFWKPMDDGTPYYVNTDLDIDSEVNIMPGAEFYFEVDKSFQIGSNGILIAKGTAENRINFTAKDVSAPWRGIGFILSDSFRNALDYVDISYAGADVISFLSRKAALGISSSSTLSFTNSTISNSLEYGMYVQDNVDLVFANNQFDNNAKTPLSLSSEQVHRLDTETTFGTTNGENYVEIFGGAINYTDEVSWSAFKDNTPYFLTGDLTISSGLNVLPNVKIMIDSDLQVRVSSSGFLSAKGESEAGLITFTAFNQSLPWKGIVFSLTDSIRNELEFVEVSYAGSSNMSNIPEKTNIGLFGSSYLSLTNSIISNSSGYGLAIDESQSEVNTDIETLNTITDNALGSMFFY